MQTQPVSARLAGIIGDLHMVEHNWADNAELSGDAEFGLYQVVKFARELHIPLLAAGDMFCSRTPSRDLMIRTASYLPNVNGFYIQGNHEKVYPPWMKLVARHWGHLQEQGVELVAEEKDLFAAAEDDRLDPESAPLFSSDRSWHVYGLDYLITADLLREKLDELGRSIEPDPAFARLLVLHQGVPPFMPAPKSELSDGMIPDCFDLAVVGHVHEAGLASIRTQGGKNIPLLSPGGLHLTAIDQDPNKKLYVLYANGSIRSKPLLTRAKMVVDFSDLSGTEILKRAGEIAESFQNLKARPHVIKTPILHAIYDKTTSPDLENFLRQTFRDRVHLFFKDQGEVAEATGPDMSVVSEIDLKRHGEEGTVYAKEIFHQVEQDPETRILFEAFLDHEVGPKSYERIKMEFQERHHAPTTQRSATELLPA